MSAEHVRLLRPTAFRRIIVDATTGRPLCVDDPVAAADTIEAQREQLLAMLRPAMVADAVEPQHDPSARLARLIDLRDPRCTGPGCSSSRCDRDHHQPWPGGATSARNLNRLSPRCHSAKHHGWTLERHPDGSTTWTSPLHRRYDRPSPWDPPPFLDPDTQLPPIRPRPGAHVPEQDDDGPLLERLVGEDVARPTPEPEPAGWDQDEPF